MSVRSLCGILVRITSTASSARCGRVVWTCEPCKYGCLRLGHRLMWWAQGNKSFALFVCLYVFLYLAMDRCVWFK